MCVQVPNPFGWAHPTAPRVGPWVLALVATLVLVVLRQPRSDGARRYCPVVWPFRCWVQCCCENFTSPLHSARVPTQIPKCEEENESGLVFDKPANSVISWNVGGCSFKLRAVSVGNKDPENYTLCVVVVWLLLPLTDILNTVLYCTTFVSVPYVMVSSLLFSPLPSVR